MNSLTTHPTTTFERHPLIAFIALTIAGAWLPMLLTPVLPYVPLALIALLAPIIAARLSGSTERAIAFPSGIQWIIVALLPLLAAVLVGYLGIFSAGYMPKYPLIEFLALTLGTAFLCASAERIAWRGWLLPQLRTSLPAIVAALILTTLTALTYLPLILLPVSQLAPGTFWEQAPLYVSIVVLFAWVWNLVRLAPKDASTTRARRIIVAIGRMLLAFPVALVVAGGMALIYHSGESRTYPPPAQMIDVGGYSLHIQCLGAGSPTVILEARLVGFSSHWHWVQQELATTNRVCAYDRAGHGWSEPGPQPRTAEQLTRELRTLLENADVPGPYVLAGNAYGGRLVIDYAAYYPDEVLGLLLVDVTALEAITDEVEHGRWVLSGVWDMMDSALLNKTPEALEVRGDRWGWLSFMEAFGLYRYTVAYSSQDYPPQLQAEITAIVPSDQNIQAATDEAIDSRPIGKPALALDNLGDLPLIVQIADHRLSPERLAQFIEGYSQPYLALSSNSRLTVVDDADHDSILANPEQARQVAAAIRAVIESARSGQALANK